MKQEYIHPARIKAAYMRFGADNGVEVCFFYNRQTQDHEFRVRWPEGRYVQPEIATRFASTLSEALQHLGILQRRRSHDNRFLRSDFDLVELM
jgi:hypothetical protein